MNTHLIDEDEDNEEQFETDENGYYIIDEGYYDDGGSEAPDTYEYENDLDNDGGF